MAPVKASRKYILPADVFPVLTDLLVAARDWATEPPLTPQVRRFTDINRKPLYIEVECFGTPEYLDTVERLTESYRISAFWPWFYKKVEKFFGSR